MFKKLDIDQERLLEDLVMKDPEAVEPGLTILTHQRPANGNWIDVLAVDDDGVLAVIELKVGEDDEMLLQALDYYDYVSSNRDRLAKEYEKAAKVVVEEDPRIILVASGFSDRLKRAARYFEPSISLREYSYLQTEGAEPGLYCKEVPFESEARYSAPVAFDTVFAYINLPATQKFCRKVHAELVGIGADMEAKTRGEHEIRYKCKNRLVGGLTTRRTFFYVWWYTGHDRYHEIKIARAGEWSTARQKGLMQMTKTYKSLGGSV